MSRRKQSHPKPIKRQSEDSLESVASALRLPLDAFRLRDPQDELHEFTLFSAKRLKTGLTFGPYAGNIVRQTPEHLNAFQTSDASGEGVHFAVTDEAGGWLKLLRPAQSTRDACNAALLHNGSSAWFTVTSDLECDTEVLVRHQWVGQAPPQEEEESKDSDADEGRSNNPYCDMLNGRAVKCEPPSPATPPSTSLDALNGSNEAPAFPCGQGTTNTTEGPVRCDQCDTFFNSRRILTVHQTYYCRAKQGSDTDTDDPNKTEAPPAHNSPGASENDDNSSPPKDLSSTPESSAARRRPTQLDVVHSSSKRHFRCQYCNYSTDKKASLTRHVRMHGGVSRAAEGPPIATPPMARYCANCDIQFASYKNYQVHKEFYCNTRHVHKSIASSSSPPAGRQPAAPSPVLRQPSPADPAPKGAYNVVLHQPLYAAISTSPLILVPCSYVAGGGDGLVPAGNIVLPHPQASSSPEHPPKSVIPTFTVEDPSATPKREAGAPTDSEIVHKEEVDGGEGEEEGVVPPPPPPEQPLDLSFRKRDGEGSRQHLPPDSVSSSSPPLDDTSAPPTLPLMTPDPGDVLSPPVLVKHGASKCVDCNIVFYKHENYLVHKSKYCAARKEGSPEAEDAGKAPQKSPLSSPRVANSRTPPPADDPCDASPLAPVVQYYCVACGIKYSSLDNLRAHQFYYCPKREVSSLVAPPPYPARSDHRCGKCKNAYPTEDLLRQHPCVVQRKCPYCDVYCPTLSAAQRHLVTHTGIKSFRCSLCGYKGHTLRGMRTHIRIHLDKNNSTPEEAYILCMDEGGAEIACAGRKSSGVRVVAHSERIKSVISTEPPELGVAASPVSAAPPLDLLAAKALPDDPVATGDATHWCQICGYSSSYKGNVVRHVKLVHKDLVATQTMSNIVHSRPGAEHLPKQDEHALLVTDHSNSSSSMDVKPAVNGLNKADPAPRPDEKPPLLKVEATSPPLSAGGSSSKGVKRPLSEDGGGGFASKSGPKYCKSCDISFNFLSNFLAHKKFYCTPRQGDAPAQESTSAQPVQ